MALWFLLSVSAGTLQAVRNATSKTASARLQPLTVTFIRFSYGVPFALIYVAILYSYKLHPGQLSFDSYVLALLGALLQLAGNTLLVSLFKDKSFLIAVTLYKLNALFSSLVGAIFFHQPLSLLGWGAVLVTMSGVVCLSQSKKPTIRTTSKEELTTWPNLWSLATASEARGILSALCITLASFCSRFATAAIVGGDLVINSGLILVLVLLLQSCLVFLLVYLYHPRDLLKLRVGWRSDIWIGASSAFGSICWFLAFNLAPVGLVNAVGQIEMPITLMASMLLFRERPRRHELIGATLVSVGVVLASLAHTIS